MPTPMRSEGSATRLNRSSLQRTSATLPSLATTSQRLVEAITDSSIVQQMALGAEAIVRGAFAGPQQHPGPGVEGVLSAAVVCRCNTSLLLFC